uniref:ATP synthase subunit 8 n=1 Tax=Hypoaspis linteyini TaxID=2695865 RepID=A0A6B9WGH5_9ACAR|nr:ATP synthase F0 subunit 8 [Hypoaspis linteyini]QHQ98576.1 ATP synthase subunit 8 [Hypoaspis linteyini]
MPQMFPSLWLSIYLTVIACWFISLTTLYFFPMKNFSPLNQNTFGTPNKIKYFFNNVA